MRLLAGDNPVTPAGWELGRNVGLCRASDAVIAGILAERWTLLYDPNAAGLKLRKEDSTAVERAASRVLRIVCLNIVPDALAVIMNRCLM